MTTDITPLDVSNDALAIELARKAIAATTENRAYILQAQADVSQFVPHEWIITVINAAYRQGKAERDDDHEYLVQQMEEQHMQAEQGMVRASVAAVMEAVMEGSPTLFVNGTYKNADRFTLGIPLNRQRTIWDRVTLTSALDSTVDDPKCVVTYTLASNKALPLSE